MEHFTDNLNRLLGLHRLTAKDLARLLDLSPSTFAKWATGERQPSWQSIVAIGDFFGLLADRIARTPFEELLANELADPERFRNVEDDAKRRLSNLKVVSGGKVG